jgi:acyl-homoserine-lactone acylase
MAEFKTILKMQALPGLNIIYADKENNIFYTDNGQFPKRNPNYNWWKLIPGDTSATLWKANDYYPIEDMVQVTNPKCGYIFNDNNTPFNCTCAAENPDPKKNKLSAFYFPYEDNRSLRVAYLLSHTGKLSYEDFKKIKFDRTFMNPAYNYAMINIEHMLHLDPKKYPQIKESIDALNKWNRNSDPNNKEAALVTLVIHDCINKLIDEGNFPSTLARIKEKFIVASLEKAQKRLKDKFGTLYVPLGDLQKLVRGDKALPIGGIPDVISAMMCKEYKNGLLQADVGESYIEMVQFTKNGPIIETVSPYGASNVPGNKHYDDQMELFVNQKLKKMSMNYDEIIKNKERVYHPG